MTSKIKNISVGLFFIVMIIVLLNWIGYSYADEIEYKTPNNNEIQIVNFQPEWNNIDNNTDKIITISKNCADDGAKMVVFPSMSLSGFMTEENIEEIKNISVDINSEYIKKITQTSLDNNLWIIFGAIEKEDNKFYNSTFAVSPQGQVSAYQQINPENTIFEPGSKPVVVNTEFGNVGLTAGNDLITLPEIARYYITTDTTNKVSNNKLHTCKMIVGCMAFNEKYNANNDDYKIAEWDMLNKIIELSNREQVFVVMANLCGSQNKENFPGGSFITVPYRNEDECRNEILAGGSQFEDYYKLEMGKQQINTIKKLHLTTNLDYDKLCYYYGEYAFKEPTCDTKNFFNPKLYAKLYKELADEQEKGNLNIEQYKDDTDIAVANVCTSCPQWGNKKAGIQNIENYLNQASNQNAKIAVFPEMSLVGYTYDENNYQWEDYNPLTNTTTPTDNKTEMHVALSETIPGPTTQYLSEKYAKAKNMYIVLGMPQKPDEGYINDDGVNKVYNSLAILCPDGTIESYQKIEPTDDEVRWSVPGSKPLLMQWSIDNHKFNVGFSVCRDGIYYPETLRYCAMKGMNLLIQSSASTQKRFNKECKLGSYVNRDNVGIVACNTNGLDGPNDKITNFKRTGFLATPYYLGFTVSDNDQYDIFGRPIEMYNTNLQEMITSNIDFGTTNIKGKGLNLKGTGFRQGQLKYETLSKLYDQLACNVIPGYEALYNGSKSFDSLSNGVDVLNNNGNIVWIVIAISCGLAICISIIFIYRKKKKDKHNFVTQLFRK